MLFEYPIEAAVLAWPVDVWRIQAGLYPLYHSGSDGSVSVGSVGGSDIWVGCERLRALAKKICI